MRILVTGGSGFVGRHLVQHLVGHGHEVVNWSLNVDAGGDGIDLRDPDALAGRDLRELDAVVHLAALAQVSSSFERPVEYIGTNVGMQGNLMEALLRGESRARVLIVSTGGVYKGGAEVITESSSTTPANPYVISKLTQELLADYYAQRGLDVMIARPFNHIGPGQGPGYLVADLAIQIAEAERTGEREVAVGRLESARDYTDVRDVVSAYRSLIIRGRAGETYNVCSGVSRTGVEIFDRLTALATVPLTAVRHGHLERPIDTDQVRASNDKLRRDTGWTPTIPLEQTLADTLAYWRDRTGEAS